MPSRYILPIVLIALVAFVLTHPERLVKTGEETKSYSEFRRNYGQTPTSPYSEVRLDQSKHRIRAKRTDGGTETCVAPVDPELADKLCQLNPNVTLYVEGTRTAEVWVQVLSSLIIPVGLFVFIVIMFRQMQAGSGQALSFGRSRAKRWTDSFDHVTFEDVAGVEEAKEELQEVVEFLKEPEKFRAMGARIPRGIILTGSPGCGKTLLARAIAGEANVPFYYISGSDFVEMFVGVGASRVRDLFEQAKANERCIVFIDEIDAVGRHRGTGLGGGHDEREQTLNQLLVEMDGFDKNSGVIILAATNRPDVLDPALLRPGRFDRRIHVDNPSLGGREGIFEIYTRDRPISPDVDLRALAQRTPGFTGADIEILVNEAAILAARRNKKEIDRSDFEDATDRVQVGLERRSKILSEGERRALAYHEAGHALMGLLLPGADPVQKVSITSRGHALGFTLQVPEEDRHMYGRQHLLDKICSTLGGRAAEELVLGDQFSGAASDLEQVADIARAMVCQFGMSERLGPLSIGRRDRQIFLGRDLVEERQISEDTARIVDEEIQSIIRHSHDRALSLMEQHRALLDAMVEALLERETLRTEELIDLVREIEGPELADRVARPRTEVTPSGLEGGGPSAGRASGGPPEG
ncbi:MAG TPA: ATP-dependent zinc metalloprotease FtsH [Armatimonadota bacterium]|nr:ATP-dependent zinc metalloprotease FtsH [Armatimonadota bacterium]